jgi:hypothetical protein
MRTVALPVAALLMASMATSACEREHQGSDCVCQPQTALETPFDNGSSTLGAENVQDAIDELAGQSPFGRIYFTDWSVFEDLDQPNLSMGAECYGEDRALSIRCEWFIGGGRDAALGVTPALVASGLDSDTGGHCAWETPGGGISYRDFRIRLLCLAATR